MVVCLHLLKFKEGPDTGGPELRTARALASRLEVQSVREVAKGVDLFTQTEDCRRNEVVGRVPEPAKVVPSGSNLLKGLNGILLGTGKSGGSVI